MEKLLLAGVVAPKSFTTPSNTMDAEWCNGLLKKTLATYPAPAIFNTDQGSQFTSEAFTSTLKTVGIRISMDGKG